MAFKRYCRSSGGRRLTETEENTVFSEIGAYIEKENHIRELMKDQEYRSIMLDLLEEEGWNIH
jgi:hypothetical protein